MDAAETSSWRERRLLRSADRAASRPRSATLGWYVALAGIAGWFVWDLFVAGRASGGRVVELLWMIATLTLALELDASLRLLGRARRGEGAGAARAPAPATASGDRLPPASLTPRDLRRLLGARAYAHHLEQLRWLLPVLAAGAVGSALAALAWAEIPRPLDLVVAAMAGVSVAAVLAVAILRGWVRLAAALAQRGGMPQA
jgi:hypothetical protein